MGTNSCGCLRGEVSCELMATLLQDLNAAFRKGMVTGAWRAFDRIRKEVEEHYQAEGIVPSARDFLKFTSSQCFFGDVSK